MQLRRLAVNYRSFQDKLSVGPSRVKHLDLWKWKRYVVPKRQWMRSPPFLDVELRRLAVNYRSFQDKLSVGPSRVKHLDLWKWKRCFVSKRRWMRSPPFLDVELRRLAVNYRRFRTNYRLDLQESSTLTYENGNDMSSRKVGEWDHRPSWMWSCADWQLITDVLRANYRLDLQDSSTLAYENGNDMSSRNVGNYQSKQSPSRNSEYHRFKSTRKRQYSYVAS